MKVIELEQEELQKNRGDDELLHLFCPCGSNSSPRKVRCGKTKEKWTTVYDWSKDSMCAVCYDMMKSQTCSCFRIDV